MKFYESDNAAIYHGLSLDVLRGMPENSIDAVVTDPPYGFAFMGRKWDYELPSVETWAEVLRVLKPGGHLLAFGGPRTYHRAVCRIEDAGFEIRDCLMWIFGSGFPKSLDVSKAIDKAAGVEREVIGTAKAKGGENLNQLSRQGAGDADHARGCGAYGQGAKQITIDIPVTVPATEAAQEWEGWGTALKPAFEPIVLARKPLDGTVAANVQAWGVGALNIDGCRIEGDVPSTVQGQSSRQGEIYGSDQRHSRQFTGHSSGRWPANVIHDGSEEVVGVFPETTSGNFSGNRNQPKTKNAFGTFALQNESGHVGDSGSAARFFYCAKATAEERNEGLDHLPEQAISRYSAQGQESTPQQTPRKEVPQRNTHPTVKPLALMRYLCRLICPPDGVILDPFFGSGSTGVAAIQEGFRVIGIEREADHCEIAKGRVSHAVRVIEKNPALPFTQDKEEKASLPLFVEVTR